MNFNLNITSLCRFQIEMYLVRVWFRVLSVFFFLFGQIRVGFLADFKPNFRVRNWYNRSAYESNPGCFVRIEFNLMYFHINPKIKYIPRKITRKRDNDIITTLARKRGKCKSFFLLNPSSLKTSWLQMYIWNSLKIKVISLLHEKQKGHCCY